jgi:hypothetical protein
MRMHIVPRQNKNEKKPRPSRKARNDVKKPSITREMRTKTAPSKKERQYQHIKEGYLKRGTKEVTAGKIAEATVNKFRRQRRETNKH